MSQPDTKGRILDVAEELFARQGFHATSLRAITGAAEVNLAAVNYHYGSKEALLDAVFERRLTPLNFERRARLDAVQALAAFEGRPPRAEELLRALIEPTLRLYETGPGAGSFILLVGRALSGSDELVRKIFLQHMGAVFTLLLDLLGQALPQLPKQQLFWRLQFSLGATGHALRWAGGGMELPGGVSPPASVEELIDMVVGFTAAGMEAP
ncbi:TetR/AcrR family transcriptional regulator [Trichloromonas sp.]|uniref:TetR/AcrR family transcriptional regulator n=1 Tax=Trichloromonas sp. TaxID=3069249 RepID=UPI003D814291